MKRNLVAEVEALVALAKKNGISKLKAEGIELEFAQAFELKTEIPTVGEKMPADDEMLFYSSDSPIQVPK